MVVREGGGQTPGWCPSVPLLQLRWIFGFSFFPPSLPPAGNGASDPLARSQGRATKSLGSGWVLFVRVCSFVRVNFLSIIVSHNVYKTSTLI